MSDKFEWKKIDVKDFWKHTKPKIHKSKKKYKWYKFYFWTIKNR